MDSKIFGAFIFLLTCLSVYCISASDARQPSPDIDRLISRDFQLCQMPPHPGSFHLSKYIDYDAGIYVLGNVTIHTYVGLHPNIDGLIEAPKPGGGQFDLIYVSPMGNKEAYVRIYGYKLREKYDGVFVEYTVFVKFDVGNNRAGRAAIDVVASTLKRCDVAKKF